MKRSEYVKFDHNKLVEFATKVFEKLGVPTDDARITADVLVAADLRGIASHGLARLQRYVNGIKSGMMNPKPNIRVVKETSSTARVDGDDGLGQPVSYRAMKMAIEKAKDTGIGIVTVFNSNHYGIAGYYAMMALEEGLIGISMTNTYPLVVPTFGRQSILGTNPIAVAVPTKEERPFVLDMATSVVPRGKLEVYARHGKEIPPQWATDEFGNPCTDPSHVLENFKQRKDGGLLPLGGAEELTGGHKGYGISMVVEILSGVLAGANYAIYTYPPGKGSKIGHFFMALDPGVFIDPDEFKSRMDDLIRTVKNSKKREGYERIYIHGEKEFEAEDDRRKNGVPLYFKGVENMENIAQELGIQMPQPLG